MAELGHMFTKVNEINIYLLGKELPDEDYVEIWESSAKSFLNILALEKSYKVLLCGYLTTARIAKFARGYSPLSC